MFGFLGSEECSELWSFPKILVKSVPLDRRESTQRKLVHGGEEGSCCLLGGPVLKRNLLPFDQLIRTPASAAAGGRSGGTIREKRNPIFAAKRIRSHLRENLTPVQ